MHLYLGEIQFSVPFCLYLSCHLDERNMLVASRKHYFSGILHLLLLGSAFCGSVGERFLGLVPVLASCLGVFGCFVCQLCWLQSEILLFDTSIHYYTYLLVAWSLYISASWSVDGQNVVTSWILPFSKYESLMLKPWSRPCCHSLGGIVAKLVMFRGRTRANSVLEGE